jgi:hypothetical protein
MPGAECLKVRNANPQLSDRLTSTPYDPHYLHQSIWAAERILSQPPEEHTDIGSQVMFVAMLAVSIPVAFVDVRPLRLNTSKLRSIAGDIVSLPFADQSVISLSCLHVVEHIGLGRYGDELNPSGTREGLLELQRVLAPRGNLFLSLPVGDPVVYFNAHRVHDAAEVVLLLEELELREFVLIDDEGTVRQSAKLSDARGLRYGCGLFWFRRPAA